MRTALSRAERMAAMRPRFADLALTSAGVVLGLLTLALQRSAADGTWREIDALAIALVLLMALPAATCRRAPIASAVTALAAALSAAALGYPPTSGWFSALLIAAAAVYLTDRRHPIVLPTLTLPRDLLAPFAPAGARAPTRLGALRAPFAAADAPGEPLGAYQLVADWCVIGVPLLLADLL